MKETILLASKADSVALQNWVPDGFTFGTWAHCFYCGVEAQCRDHVIPYIFLFAEDRANRDGRQGMCTPTCTDCNVGLQAALFPSLAERCMSAADRLRRRNKKLMRLPEWKGHEIKELGKNLKKNLQIQLLKKKIMVGRLAWQTTPLFFSIFEQAYEDAKISFPKNTKLHKFMTPPWKTKNDPKPPLNSENLVKESPRTTRWPNESADERSWSN